MYVPALIQCDGASPAGGFSMNASHAAVVVEGHDTEARRVVDPGEVDGAFGPPGLVQGPQLTQVEVGEHVAVDDHEPLVDPDLEGGEAHGAGGVERLGLDGVVQGDAGARAVGEGVEEGVGPVAERQHDLGDALAPEAGHDAFEHGGPDDGQHLLGRVPGEGPQPGAEPPDEQDGAHAGASPSLTGRRCGRRGGAAAAGGIDGDLRAAGAAGKFEARGQAAGSGHATGAAGGIAHVVEVVELRDALGLGDRLRSPSGVTANV